MLVELTKEEPEIGKPIYWVKMKTDNGMAIAYKRFLNHEDAKKFYDATTSESIEEEQILESKTV